MKLTMNKVLITTLLGAALLAVSCSKEVPDTDTNTATLSGISGIEWDCAPVVISIQVLSPHSYSTLPYTDLSTVRAEFRGESYYCGVAPEPSRTILPNFYGLKAQNDYLLFGELNGAETYDHEQLIINWGNDAIKNDTIVFSRTISSNGKVEMDYWVNGIHVKKYGPGEEMTMELGRSTEWAAGKGRLTLYKDLAALNNTNLKTTTPISLTDLQEGAILQLNHFQFNLLHKMLESGEKSVVSSPLSVAYLLAMLASGAAASEATVPTAAEILLALEGYDEHSAVASIICDGPTFRNAPINTLLQTFIEQAPKCDPEVELTIANALFARQDFPLYNGYVNYIADTYHADYDQLDFTSPTALQAINNWCYQKTRGMIPKILNEIAPDAVAYALNAIYFKAPWAQQFDKALTQPAPFYKADGSTTQVPMMYNICSLTYRKTGNMEAVLLPFANGAYNMIIALPPEGQSLSQMTDFGYGLTVAVDLKSMEQAPEPSTVSLSLPRFSTETTNTQLKSQLQQLGIRSIFNQELARLTEVSSEPLFVSDILQKARISVSEAGCEAAAVTAAYVTTGKAPDNIIEFHADRPFLYFITERSTGLILFAGAYCGD